jgi:ABC-type branched-subunit amino acid transport system ATPase component
MAWLSRGKDNAAAHRGPVLAVDGLDVYYGRAHALQGVGFAIDHGITAVVGRNGMGKTTL